MIVKGALTSITLATLVVVEAATVPLQRFSARQSNNGLQDAVTWDNHTIIVNGEREFLFSGEFHYYRIPSPGLWDDILQKFKALGFNGVSYYFNWGYHSPKKGVYDFTGVRDIQRALDAAKEVGLHVISRAGPYINAEVDCGGLPSWLMNMKSPARKDNEEYKGHWEEWLKEVDKYLVPNQITHNGNIILNQIENEYADNTDSKYMQDLIDFFEADGIVVPSTFNDPNTGNHFASGEGSVDIYGWDAYPLGFDCSHPDVWPTNAPNYYREYHEKTNPSQPMALYEFQGGAFDPWGGPGYGACREMVNEKFAKIFYKNNYAQGATIQSLYMTYGGTSWGGLAKPSVYTSYDYGAPISEPGLMTTKAYEIKLQSTFIHTVKPFSTTNFFWPTWDTDEVQIYGRKDVNSATQFFFTQQKVTNSTSTVDFHINIETSDGKFTIPRSSKLILNGRDSKILAADYDFESQHLVYATSEIFTHFSTGSVDVLAVYAYEGEEGEIALKINENVTVRSSDKGVTSSASDGITQINYEHPKNGTTAIQVSGGDKDVLILVSGYSTATKWWAPVVSKEQRVLIQGPYLVRSASISGDTLSFLGDIDTDTPIEVVASDNIRNFHWNGKNVSLKKSSYGSWTGIIKFQKPNIKITDLTKATWKYSPASPESDPNFDDSKWLTADHTTTNSTTEPISLPVLYADDYGFHTGCIWFRGTFDGSSDITGLKITAVSGAGSAWLAWLNGEFLGGFDIGSQELTKLSALKTDGENVLSLLLWTTGHEDDWNVDDAYKSARGFSQAELLGSDAKISWKVQGNLGGEDLADPVRGPYNEGGLYGERKGWHLPDFTGEQDGNWTEASVPETKGRAGVSWYITTFSVKIPKGYDAPLSLTFEDDSDQKYRALVFVNGWQLGRYANDLGPQKQYYCPEGIVKTNGASNSLAIAVIGLDKEVKLGKVVLEPYAVLASAKPTVETVNSPAYEARN